MADRDDLSDYRRLRARCEVLLSLVPGFWWTSPPNRATKDVVEGLTSVRELLREAEVVE